ncbi:MAG: class I SAM-dependent methyltransferase [Sedimentisphaerales bacterium]|nr:class I SAM-dependent methyltransferase [Sedimentisphaerales bacterium]
MFYELFKPEKHSKVLDIGAEIDPDGDQQLQLIDSYPWRPSLSALNIDENHIEKIRGTYPEISVFVADACQLPFPDKSFDIIYSNAVIEHVGDFERQKKMASEIMRVGKNWFVTTPNRWYPFEFHLRLPFVTWLPGSGYLYAGQIMCYNHAREKYTFFSAKHKHLRLLTAREIKVCFPGSRLILQKVTFWPETIIAVGGDAFTE